MQAALTLFAEKGYDDTTVTDIADRAGLTKRTFFRYFADKREVLFAGSGELTDLWLTAVAAAPPDATPLAAVSAAFDPVAAMFGERFPLARGRAEIIAAHPDLVERELIKLQSLAASIAAVLQERGCPANPATLAAQAGVTVFYVAFARWVEQDDGTAFRRLLGESLAELRAVAAG